MTTVPRSRDTPASQPEGRKRGENQVVMSNSFCRCRPQLSRRVEVKVVYSPAELEHGFQINLAQAYALQSPLQSWLKQILPPPDITIIRV